MRPIKKRILTLALKFMGISEGLEKGGTGQVVLARLRGPSMLQRDHWQMKCFTKRDCT